MRYQIFTAMCVVLVLLLWTSLGVAQNKKVSPQIIEKAQQEGKVRVIISLDVATVPEVHLDPQAIQKQRNSIAEAQNRIVEELQGAKFRVIGRFKTVPGIALEVDLIGLAILENSLTATEVSESRTHPLTH